MKPTEKILYNFMTSCGGNWRNTIYVANPEHPGSGILIAFDRDAKAVLMTVSELRAVSDEDIDPSDCRVTLDIAAFRDLFRRSLDWNSASDEVDPNGA